jgi:hypothetical protein
MLNGNLSTRPFYNDRLVNLGILLGALLVVLMTGYNAWKLVTLSRQRTEYKAQIDRDAAEAARLRATAAATEHGLNPASLAGLYDQSLEANDLIDERTFSWTAFFGVIEKTLPIDARLTVVTPRVDRGVFRVSMTVVAKDLTDVSDFCDAMNDTGQFYDVAPTDQHPQDDGTVAATVEASYRSANPPAPLSAPGAKSSARPPRS